MDKQGVVPNYLKLVKKDDSVVKKDDSKEIEVKDRIKALEMELLDKELRLIELEKEIRQLKEKDNIKSWSRRRVSPQLLQAARVSTRK